MELTGTRLPVTGGAGFVGSHHADRLISDNEVVVVDDCSNGCRECVPDQSSDDAVPQATMELLDEREASDDTDPGGTFCEVTTPGTVCDARWRRC